MFKRFRPNEFAETVMDIDYKAMLERGVRGLIFDIDNTLEGYAAAVPSDKTATFLDALVKMGFKLCFVSNNNKERVLAFNAGLDFPAIYKSNKPSKKAVYRAAALMGVPVSATSVIGDQIFTDIYCGNRCGVYTVLVNPVTAYDPLQIRLKRILERKIVKYFKKH